MSTTVTKKTYNGKKNYYGKYYTYKKIRNLMNTYFRAKLTYSCATAIVPIQDTSNFKYQLKVEAQIISGLGLATLCIGSPKWSYYRQLFGYYKCRGVVFEVVPGVETPALVVNNQVQQPFQGNIAIGLTNSTVAMTYAQIQEANMKVIFSRTQTVRKYFPFLVKDFSESPNADNVIPNGIPYNVFIGTSETLTNQRGQMFQINLTFYITFRQSLA